MRDHVIFAVAPYVAVLSFVSLCIVRVVRTPSSVEHVDADDASRVAAIWRVAMVVVLIGHVVVFAMPDRVLLWNREPLRLFVLEGSGWIAGGLALSALLWTLARRVRAADQVGAWSTIDVIVGTLVVLEVVSGLTIAVLYRWASSWSVVTLAPYVRSLVRVDPTIVLVSSMPLLVRLHVFCAFAIVALLPLTRLARFPLRVLNGLTVRTFAPATNQCVQGYRAIQAWSAKNVQALQAATIRGDGEEN